MEIIPVSPHEWKIMETLRQPRVDNVSAQAQEEAPSKFVGQNKDCHLTPPWHEHKLSRTQSVHAAGEKKRKKEKKEAPSAKQEFSSSARIYCNTAQYQWRSHLQTCIYRSSAASSFFLFFFSLEHAMQFCWDKTNFAATKLHLVAEAANESRGRLPAANATSGVKASRSRSSLSSDVVLRPQRP